MKTLSSVAHWLDQFAACVRNRDLEKGRELFDESVRGFGTRAEQAHDLPDLVKHQWSKVWFNTRGFRFLEGTVHELASDDGSLICVMALWASEGLDSEDLPFPRAGRCTLLLRPDESRSAGYVAVHTHFSKTPPDEL